MSIVRRTLLSLGRRYHHTTSPQGLAVRFSKPDPLNSLFRSRDHLPLLFVVIIVGCGSYQPIEWYAGHTHSPYPVYACPSLELHKIFGFTTKLGASKKGEEKEYERDLGGMMSRVWMGLVVGPMQHIEHMSSVGPKGQNGGEMVFEAGESQTRGRGFYRFG